MSTDRRRLLHSDLPLLRRKTPRYRKRSMGVFSFPGGSRSMAARTWAIVAGFALSTLAFGAFAQPGPPPAGPPPPGPAAPVGPPPPAWSPAPGAPPPYAGPPPPAGQPMPAPYVVYQPYPPPQPYAPPQSYAPPQPPAPPAPEEQGPRPYATFTMGIFYYQYFGAGLGATLGAHLLPKTVLEVDAYRAAAAAPEQTSDSIAVRVQQMAGEHVYVRGGLRIRRLEVVSTLDYDDYEKRLRQNDFGVDMAVGFRWDRSNFVLGLDAIGVYAPVQAFFSEEQIRDKTNNELLAVSDPGLHVNWDVRLAYLNLGARF